MLSLIFGQQWRSSERFDPMSDQVVAFKLERPELGVPSSSLAVNDLPRPPRYSEIEGKVNYKLETEGLPLFTSLTLNIRRIEVEERCLEAKD